MTTAHRPRPRALIVAVVVALGLLAPPIGPAGAAAEFTVQGSIEMVASWGHEPGTEVELIGPGGDVLDSEPADEQGASLFERVVPGDGYRVRAGGETSDPVAVIDPDVHPDQSIYEGVEIGSGYGYIPTRDGTLLSANVAFPDSGTWGPGPWPTVVIYSGYDPSNPAGLPVEALLYLFRGYAVVGVNMRGSGCSGGAFHYNTAPAGTDGYDAIEALAHQPWSNGRVGMVGISYSGISQLYVAATQPPHLEAITPLSPYGDALSGILYPGGIRNEGFALDWALDRQAAARPAARPWARDRIEGGDTVCAENQRLRLQSQDIESEIQPVRFMEDGYRYLDMNGLVDSIDVPTYLSSQFQDEQTGGSAVDLALRFQDNGVPFRALFSNGTHVEPMGPTELPRVVEFVDFYVGQQIPDLTTLNLILPAALGGIFDPPINVVPNRFDGYGSFAEAKAAYEQEEPIRIRYEVGGVAGLEGGPYATADGLYSAYPVPGTTVERWYLQPDGGLAADAPTITGDDPRGATAYRYDPDEGRKSTFDGGTDRMWKRHPDVHWESPGERTHLTFTTPEAETTEVYAGRASVDLWLRSTAVDTDLEVVLTEVRPDGQEVYIQSGWLRASRRALDTARSTELHPVHTHREADAADLPAGEFVPVRVASFPFAHVVRPGSSLRLSIEAPGGNQPFWEFTSLEGTSTNEVAHSADHPSSLALPRLPASAHPADLPSTAPSCSVEGVTVQSQSLRNQPCRDDRAPRRATDVAAAAGPAPGSATVTWTAPVPWADGVAPDAYDVAIGGETVRVDGPAVSVVVAGLPTEVDLAATVTPVHGGEPGATSTPSSAIRLNGADGAWVDAAWVDLTGSPGGPADADAITARLVSGATTRRATAATMGTQTEAREHTVRALYGDLLGRNPGAGEVAYWADRLAAPSWSEARTGAALLASAEYRSSAGDDAAWIAAIYRDALGRTAGAGEVAYWVGRPEAPGRIAWSIVGSAEGGRHWAATAFTRYLGRSAGAGDLSFWGPWVQARGDLALAVELLATSEYDARARARFP
ncbi:MAG: CocE/NonD family hydrolase [Acidimicrobiales bacterium]|nr:CocE/NonD family hydrolase [Acidimicrobiales bacterium]